MTTPEFAVGRDLPQKVLRAITRVSDDGRVSAEDMVATEYALTVFVNQREMATVVCTPEHMDELVIGFLASEGVIRTVNQVKSLQISTFRGTARVETTTDVTFNQEFYNKRYIASCCGKSRQSFYFANDAHTARNVEDRTPLSVVSVLKLMQSLEDAGQLFQETGGVHVASLSEGFGVLATRSDIGRHNALDKLYGYQMMRQSQRKGGQVVVFSGRLSSEVLLKVAKIGAGVVIAKSAPTALALDIADELNITTVGFVRQRAFNIYTHPWRIHDAVC